MSVSTKTVGGGIVKDDDFNFTITLSDTEINGEYGEIEFTDGVANIVLKDGESKTAKGLEPGITFTVEETNANANGYEIEQESQTGEIKGGKIAEATFENKRESGELLIKIGTRDDSHFKFADDAEFNIQITAQKIGSSETDDSFSYKTTDGLEFSGGIANIKIRANTEKTLHLVPGRYYYAEMTDFAASDWQTTPYYTDSFNILSDNTGRKSGGLITKNETLIVDWSTLRATLRGVTFSKQLSEDPDFRTAVKSSDPDYSKIWKINVHAENKFGFSIASGNNKDVDYGNSHYQDQIEFDEDGNAVVELQLSSSNAYKQFFFPAGTTITMSEDLSDVSGWYPMYLGNGTDFEATYNQYLISATVRNVRGVAPASISSSPKLAKQAQMNSYTFCVDDFDYLFDDDADSVDSDD